MPPTSQETAVQTITQKPDDNIVLISVRLTFGGVPCPFQWGVISDNVCNLANAILQDKTWDPLKLYAPFSVPVHTSIDKATPFSIRHELILDYPLD